MSTTSEPRLSVLLDELAGTWEVMAEMEKDSKPGRRETLRECADGVRMLADIIRRATAVSSPRPALVTAPQAAGPVADTEFCWLVEEFAGGNSTGRYMLDQVELTITSSVHDARRFRRMRTAMFRAEDMRKKHGGAWRHAHHGFIAPQAAQAQPSADLRADFERECADTDKLLAALGWKPENCRTDGGSLKLGMILEALEARDRLIRREAAQAQPQEPPRSAPLTERGCHTCALQMVDTHRCDSCHRSNGWANWVARGISTPEEQR
jgi:hypothetical protein